MPKPKNIDEYLEWAASALGCDFKAESNKNRYNSNLTNFVNDLNSNVFYTNLLEKLLDWEKEYSEVHSTSLFMHPPDAKIHQKSYESFINKSFRINVLWNKRFPNEPKNGWINIDSLYSLINDLVRTQLVCKFWTIQELTYQLCSY